MCEFKRMCDCMCPCHLHTENQFKFPYQPALKIIHQINFIKLFQLMTRKMYARAFDLGLLTWKL